MIPAFTIDGTVDNMTDVLVPGKMINMGECVVVGGGPVTNAGVSIRRLGVKTELIGKVGNTGLSTGSHLHWEMWVGGTSVNALQWLEDSFPWQEAQWMGIGG